MTAAVDLFRCTLLLWPLSVLAAGGVWVGVREKRQRQAQR